MNRRLILLFSLLLLLTPALLIVDVCTGAVGLSLSQVVDALSGHTDESTRLIVVDIRLVKATVAMLAGMSLSVSGLQMQTLFRNPLSGPYVLGVSSGAGLGVALVLLAAPLIGAPGSMGVALAAWLGAAAVLGLITLASLKIKDIMVILILGIMLSSAITAIVQMLQYISREDALKSFVVWTMGSLGEVTASRLPIMVGGICSGIILAVATIKPLNMLLLGEAYARSMGLNLTKSRVIIMISTTLLAGTVTAFCGPIGFVGLAMPHVARALTRQADHRILLPASALVGSAVMIGCDILSKSFTLPINSLTSLVGIPVVAWVILSNKSFSS